MYPPPPDAVLQQLKHRVVDAVSYGKYVIHLGLDQGNGLSFEAPFRFAEPDCLGDSSIVEFPLNESSLIRILGSSITEIDCDEDGTLELGFSNGDALVIYANDRQYEAYTLRVDGHEYFV